MKRAIAGGTLAHAYLFSGERGIGKKLTALGLAAAVNCKGPGPEGGCGECVSCRKVSELLHPDVHLVSADGDEIKIDQIRQAQAEVSLKPFEGRKKVLIIDPAEDMNAASANAFLKTLEEPPADTIIILISAMPQGLLPTIRSRCQEIQFHPIPRNTLTRLLTERRGMSHEDASFIACIAMGSFGRAIGMDAAVERAAMDEVMALWARLGDMSPSDILSHAEAYSKDRERLEKFLNTGVEWLRDSIVYHETGDERLLMHSRHKDTLGQWGERFSRQRMLSDIELLDASRRMLDRRVSAQLVTENLFFKLGRG